MKTPLTLNAPLERLFPWLTRIGAGRKFDSLPIGWYQQHQCHCLDILKEYGIAPDDKLRCNNGTIDAFRNGSWWGYVKVVDLFAQADKRCRK